MDIITCSKHNYSSINNPCPDCAIDYNKVKELELILTHIKEALMTDEEADELSWRYGGGLGNWGYKVGVQEQRARIQNILDGGK